VREFGGTIVPVATFDPVSSWRGMRVLYFFEPWRQIVHLAAWVVSGLAVRTGD
jgi:hypothetical protein